MNMKKMMFMACLAMLTFLITGCEKSSETKKVADKFVEFNKNEDLDGMFEIIYFKDEKTREETKSFMKDKVLKQDNQKKKKKIKSYEFVDETVDDEKGTAVVNYNITYENDSTTKEQVKLKRFDGKWMVDAGK